MILGPIPKGQSKTALRHWLIGSQIYVSILLICLFLTLVFAVLLARSIRKEYREKASDAMKELIEGTMEDHKRKSAKPTDPE